MKVLFLSVILGSGALLGGCSRVCPAVAAPYLTVEVRDAQTGAPAAEGATGTASDGAFVDPLNAFDNLVMVPETYERPGVYDVLVRKPGYEDWTAENVRVRDGMCNVQTVDLQARLERTPQSVPPGLVIPTLSQQRRE